MISDVCSGQREQPWRQGQDWGAQVPWGISVPSSIPEGIWDTAWAWAEGRNCPGFWSSDRHPDWAHSFCPRQGTPPAGPSLDPGQAPPGRGSGRMDLDRVCAAVGLSQPLGSAMHQFPSLGVQARMQPAWTCSLREAHSPAFLPDVLGLLIQIKGHRSVC